MNSLDEFLKYDYKNPRLATSKDCLPFDMLYAYTRDKLTKSEKEASETHLAICRQCLDTVVSIHEGNKTLYNNRRFEMKKENIFLMLTVVFFILSFIFSGHFLQFLAGAVILGIKWVVDSKNNKTLIMIYDAWKRGGDSEAGAIIKNIETKRR